jgi:hypothetical protein
MATSYPVTLPFATKTARRITIRPRSAVASNVSPFTFQDEVQASTGQRWEATVELPPMLRAGGGAAWIAALTSLDGIYGTFLLGDTAWKTARGIATGTPLVKGGSQTGYDLITDGWTAGQTGIMKAGDWLQLGSAGTSQLHMVMADANSNGSGEATLTLWPRLRSSPADNAAIVVSSPRGLFRLAGPIDWSLGAEAMLEAGLVFSAVEAN